MKNITLESIKSYLGEPEKITGSEYIWQCPLCSEAGGDTHRDNLKFNAEKGLLWCFADDTHAPEILRNLYKNGHLNPRTNNHMSYLEEQQMKINKIHSPLKQMEYKWKMIDSNKLLLKSELYLYTLKDFRGLEFSTIDSVKLGVDADKHRWVVPIFEYSTEDNKVILGFEYRNTSWKKKEIYREKNTPSALAMINSYNPSTEVLAVVEGFFDGYALFQHLSENNQIKYYHIVTPSNGVNSLLKNIPLINFSKYKKFYLYLDNDDAGNKVAQQVMEQYPMFERIITNCGCKDFNEHYLKCIKPKNL